MKRNPVAWAALIVASAALVSSSGFLRPMPAAPKVPLEGQQAAKSLSEAYEAVAEFVRPSVVQITVQKKAGGHARHPGMPNMRRFQFPPRGNGNGNENQIPRDFEDMLRKFLNPDGAPRTEQFGGRPATGGRLGFRLRQSRPHPDQQPRGRERRQDHRGLLRRRRGSRRRSSAPTSRPTSP